MAEQQGKGGRLHYLFAIMMIAVIGVAIPATVLSKKPAPKTPGDDTQTTITGATYVGSQECKGCHQEKHKGWLGTLHPYKIRKVSREAVRGDFWQDNVNRSYEKDFNITITMKEVNGRFFINTVNKDGQYQDFEVKYTMGGEFNQRYVTELPDGGLHVLPVTWADNHRRWGGYGSANPDAGNFWMNRNRLFQTNCGSCHVTGLDIGYDERTDTFNTTWVDEGIACESCHGPGSNHIASAPGYESQTIINPSQLPFTKSRNDVCGQCHNRGVSTDLVTDHYKIPGVNERFSFPYKYQIGNNLEDYFTSVDKNKYFWPSGDSKNPRQQIIDYRKSKHFMKGVTCLDCHQGLHGESGTNRLTKLPNNQLCINCHNAPAKNNFGVHGIHASGSCVECHMPRTTRGLINRSHTFKIIYPQSTVDAGGLGKQPNSCNTCHYHKDEDPAAMQGAIKKIRDDRRKTFGLK